jgi:hypothetical protein
MQVPDNVTKAVLSNSANPGMRTVGRRTERSPTLLGSAEQLAEFGRFNDEFHRLARTTIMLPKGVFRLTHAEANEQMLNGVSMGVAINKLERCHE